MNQKPEKNVEIYTDGACSGNPGPGGWGVVMRYEGTEKELSGGDPSTTNNRMELTAAIKALETLKRPVHVDLYTDSMYVRDGITQWLDKWKTNGWKTANRKPVRNADLWQELDTLNQKFHVNWHWVKAHNNHKDNDRADLLARNAIVKAFIEGPLEDMGKGS